MTRDEARALDAADPLRAHRDRFRVPDGLVYLDGNSLGCLPRATVAAQRDAVERQWGDGLVRSWNEEGWIDAPARIGAAIAPLIGADADEVIVADSVSVNLFRLITAAAAIGGKPGQAHEISAWEYVFAAMPHINAGDLEEAERVMQEGLEEKPGDPAMLYNLACLEARAGKTDAALDHLTAAADGHERFRKAAQTDEAFASIRPAEQPGRPD